MAKITKTGSLTNFLDRLSSNYPNKLTPSDYPVTINWSTVTDTETRLTDFSYKIYITFNYATSVTVVSSSTQFNFNFADQEQTTFDTSAGPSYVHAPWTSDTTLTATKTGTKVQVASGKLTGLRLHHSITGLPYDTDPTAIIDISPTKFNIELKQGSHTGRFVGHFDLNNYLEPVVTAADVFCSSAHLGETITITIANKFTSPISGGKVRNTIHYEFGTKTGTIITNTEQSSIEWTPPMDFISEFSPDEYQHVGRIYSTTTFYHYSTGTLTAYGEGSCPLTLMLPAGDLVPILNPVVKDINPTTIALTGNANTIVRYMSTVEYAINATPLFGAEIVTQQLKNGSLVIENVPHGTINGVENGTFEFLAIDNRDLGSAMTMVVPFVEYIKLTCNQKVTIDLDGETSAIARSEITGTYFDGSFGAVNNTLTIEVRHTTNDGEMGAWETLPLEKLKIDSKGRYSINFEVSDLRYDISYVFQTRATDVFGQVTTSEYTLRVLPVFDWSREDFEVNVVTAFNEDVSFKQDGTMTIGENCSIVNEGDTLTITAPEKIVLDAQDVTLNGTTLVNIETGIWYPDFSVSSAIMTYNSRRGWYERIGNTVTVGFNLGAVCQDTYNTTPLVITGLPFTPAYTAFGGGVCSRATVAAGYNFQCWAANTDGTITARLQNCNLTTNASLGTTASGCYYGGADVAITLGGTISYIIDE